MRTRTREAHSLGDVFLYETDNFYLMCRFCELPCCIAVLSLCFLTFIPCSGSPAHTAISSGKLDLLKKYGLTDKVSGC